MTPLRPRNPYKADRPYLNWISHQPCLVNGPGLRCDPAHVQRKTEGHDRGNVVALRHALHVELHWIGTESFQRRYGVDLKAEALRLEAEYPGEEWTW